MNVFISKEECFILLNIFDIMTISGILFLLYFYSYIFIHLPLIFFNTLRLTLISGRTIN